MSSNNQGASNVFVSAATSFFVFGAERLGYSVSRGPCSGTADDNDKVAELCSICEESPSVLSCNVSLMRFPHSDPLYSPTNYASGEMASATDETPHYFCQGCLNCYFAKIALDEQIRVSDRTQSNRMSLVRHVGDFPCPFFAGGHCSCNSLPLDKVESQLSDTLMIQYKQAMIRIMADSEQPQSDESPDIPSICSICGDDSAVISCEGAAPHNLCSDCFNTYAQTAFEEGGGIFTKEYRENGQVSGPGELPCPFFQGGYCSCTAIPRSEFIQHFSEETMDLWEQARDRVAVAKADRERRDAQQALTEAAQNQQPVELLIRAVHEALSIGGGVACPNCSVRGEKDDACMHIWCSECHCSWCYCCGRPRGTGPGQCFTCDAHGVYLQSKNGWQNLNQGDESKGYGALHEFHRQRQRFFLRKIKESVPNQLWSLLRTTAAPEVLRNVPTAGRHIEWENIDSAQPPLFGRTREVDLLWRNDADQIISSLQEQFGGNLQQNLGIPHQPNNIHLEQNHQPDNIRLDPNEPNGIHLAVAEEGNRERRRRRRSPIRSLFRRLFRLLRRRNRQNHAEAEPRGLQAAQGQEVQAPQGGLQAVHNEFDAGVLQDLVDDILQFGGPGDTELLQRLVGYERYQELVQAI